jgi:hypothetical protein
MAEIEEMFGSAIGKESSWLVEISKQIIYSKIGGYMLTLKFCRNIYGKERS